MTVRAVEAAADFQRYLDFAKQVYRDNPCWMPEDEHHLLGLWRGESPLSAGCRVRAMMAEDSRGIDAAVTAVVDPAFNRHWNQSAGHLFFFEALPDRHEAARALLDEACRWLKSEGCQFARLGFLYGWQIGLPIDAYDEIPTFLHDYSQPYYHSLIKNAGFFTEKGLVEYQIRFRDELAALYRQRIEQAQNAGVRLRPWDFSRLEAETALFADLYNETFRDHWGTPQFTFDQMAGLTVGMRDLLVPEWLLFAEVDGTTAGVVYSLPEMNRVFRGQPRDHGVLLCIGVKQQYRGRGINLALAGASYLAMIGSGCRSASYTIVLDDNWPSRRTAEKLGGRVARSFNVYRRDLA